MPHTLKRRMWTYTCLFLISQLMCTLHASKWSSKSRCAWFLMWNLWYWVCKIMSICLHFQTMLHDNWRPVQIFGKFVMQLNLKNRSFPTLEYKYFFILRKEVLFCKWAGCKYNSIFNSNDQLLDVWFTDITMLTRYYELLPFYSSLNNVYIGQCLKSNNCNAVHLYSVRSL